MRWDVEIDLKLDVVFQHVGRVEHLQTNHGALLIKICVDARRHHRRRGRRCPRCRQPRTQNVPGWIVLYIHGTIRAWELN